jgi:glycosyltransferase involved in cell wall biosynthesis
MRRGSNLGRKMVKFASPRIIAAMTHTLSVIIPVYNERKTIEEIVRRVRKTGLAQEIIIVDDGSRDGTRDLLPALDGQNGVRVILHETNQGKGAAVRTGIGAATGELLLIQDADLEYDPREYPHLLQPIEEGLADVVYGSRFLGAPHRAILFWNMVANKMLTLMTNILYNTILSDMETGYKVFRREVVQGMRLRSKRFDFEPEFTAKILKRRFRVFEVAIAFNPRDYDEGKKIGLRDAFEAAWTLLKYRFVD